MRDRVDVSSFEAVEDFRSAVIRFVESANAALTSADVEISRTINWLESEQLPYWKAMLRKTADEIDKAKLAYREKALFKDSSGARHSAIDELKALRRAEAKREEVERRARATRRNLRQLQRELTLYKGAAAQLGQMVNGTLASAVQELGQVVEQLERYVHAAPETVTPAELAGMMSRESALFEIRETTPGELVEAQQEDALRRRTPGPDARRAAARAEFAPELPEMPASVEQAMLPLDEPPPGRYDLVTTTLAADDPGGDVYLERREPTSPSDTGWHIGPAGDEVSPVQCVTITAGRIASARPELHRLLALPVGWFLRAAGGKLVAIVDPLGRTVWRAEA